jgi:LysM repeat protein
MLLILRKDVNAAAQTGPRWKRRLIGATLALLAALGISIGGCEPPVTRHVPVVPASQPDRPNESQAKLMRLRAKVAVLEQQAKNKSLGDELLMEQYRTAVQDARELLTAENPLPPAQQAEVDALLSQAENAMKGLFPPTTSCYFPMPGAIFRDYLTELEQSPPLLRKMLDQGRIDAAVAARMVSGLKDKLKYVLGKNEFAYATPQEQDRVRRVVRQAKPLITQIERAIGQAPEELPDPPPPPPPGRPYTIKASDTLYGIARGQLGNGQRWQEIVAMNPGLDPTRLAVGQTIRLPEK